MNAKAETQSISMEYDLPYPPAKVWRALTEPELLAAWLMLNDMRPVVFAQAPPLFVAERAGVVAPGHRGYLDAHADATRWHTARA
jgi:uncharacterized protein YndB with AHSA1/START domain